MPRKQDAFGGSWGGFVGVLCDIKPQTIYHTSPIVFCPIFRRLNLGIFEEGLYKEAVPPPPYFLSSLLSLALIFPSTVFSLPPVRVFF